jgi:predicted ABC-type ATPase
MMGSNAAARAIVLAGPNGAGKTTCAPLLLLDALRLGTYVNADVIAQGLSAFAPETAEKEAGRIMLRRLDALEAAGHSFAFEATLSGHGHLRRLQRLRDRGYEVMIFFLWLPSPELAIARVAMRVRHGGHHVPADVIRRRYRRGLRNFLELYRPLASTWRVYDAGGSLDSTAGVPLVARGDGAEILEIRSGARWQRITSPIHRVRERPGPAYGAPAGGPPQPEPEDALDHAMIGAFHAAVRLHRRHGLPLVLWMDDEVRCVDAREVRLPEDAV